VRRGLNKQYDAYKVTLGIMDTMVKIKERKAKGKKMTNMKWDVNLSQILTTFYTVSPLVGCIFRAQVGGPNLRTFKYVSYFLRLCDVLMALRALQAKHGRFQPGIHPSNFDAAWAWVTEMSHDGPLTLQVNDTLLMPAIRAYQDNGQWRVAGMDRVIKNFETYEQLTQRIF
jgi:hypothetical protein